MISPGPAEGSSTIMQNRAQKKLLSSGSGSESDNHVRKRKCYQQNINLQVWITIR